MKTSGNEELAMSRILESAGCIPDTATACKATAFDESVLRLFQKQFAGSASLVSCY